MGSVTLAGKLNESFLEKLLDEAENFGIVVNIESSSKPLSVL
jgi:hypothetical protein